MRGRFTPRAAPFATGRMMRGRPTLRAAAPGGRARA